MDFETEEFESIPLPDQFPTASPQSQPSPITPRDPKPLSFLEPEAQTETHNSSHTKSRTIQTLLNQNQDLMSRLSVALKKNVELEQRLEENEDQFHHLKNQFESSFDQNTIFKEKNKYLENQIQQLLNETQKQDKKFADLYNAYQEKIGYIQKLSYRVHRFLKYRTRIRGYIRPLINRLKAEILECKAQLLSASQKIMDQESLIQNLKAKIQDSVDYIQKQTQTFEHDQAELVGYHETRFQALTEEHEKLLTAHTESSNLNKDQKAQIEALKEQEVELTNKSIYFERIFTDLKAEFDTLQLQATETQQHDSQKIKHLEAHTQQLSEKLNEAIQYAQNLYNDHTALNDQHASLQILFQENLSKNEDYKKRLSSLEQMNKELSQSLLEHRKKNDLLEEKLTKAEDDFKRKLESFQYRFQKPDLTLSKALPQVGQKELLNKIQNLLSEIQTGHSQVEPTNEKTKLNSSSSELLSEGGDIGQGVSSESTDISSKN